MPRNNLDWEPTPKDSSQWFFGVLSTLFLLGCVVAAIAAH